MTVEITSRVVPLKWCGDRETGHLQMLDQRLLPGREVWLDMTSDRDVRRGIADMVIRGAPAIGIAAAYGFALGLRAFAYDPMVSLTSELDRLDEQLGSARPTAVNLRWALYRCRSRVEALEAQRAHLDEIVDALFDEAEAIWREDRDNNLALARHGLSLFEQPSRILTHCNTGGLATGGIGTALGVIRALDAASLLQHVWVDETRPYLQGARLTAWECAEDSLDATVITDSMAAHYMAQGLVDAVIVGTDRVARNGDVANKIGTYALAVLADHHEIPFYVASPISTLDPHTPSGAQIPIEERDPSEVTPDFPAAHPAFDVTPAGLVSAIITERGVHRPPLAESLPFPG